MESGRIEPLRPLPVHREASALLPATPVSQIYTMYIDFPLDGTSLPWSGNLLSNALEAPEGPCRPLEASGGP